MRLEPAATDRRVCGVGVPGRSVESENGPASSAVNPWLLRLAVYPASRTRNARVARTREGGHQSSPGLVPKVCDPRSASELRLRSPGLRTVAHVDPKVRLRDSSRCRTPAPRTRTDA